MNEHFDELKHSGKLPSPSGLGMRLLMLTRNEDCSMDDVVKTLQSDPALTGRLIKMANSVTSAGLHGVTTVKEAAVRLGMRSVCNVGLGFSLVSGNRSGRCRGFDYARYWSWSLANAVAAQIVSERLRIGSSAELFTCALLSRIGRLALASVHPEDYATILDKLREHPTLDLAVLETEVFCIHHREVAASLLGDWSLPTLFQEVVLHFDGEEPPENLEHNVARDYLRVLNAASRLAEVCVSEADAQHALWPATQRACAELGMDDEALREVYGQILPEWKEWGTTLQIPIQTGLDAAAIEERVREAERKVADEPPEPGASLRILAVDDEPVSLRLLVRQLERDGHQVVTARDGREALAVAVQWHPQMVITDWMMPEIDGLELCKQLRSTDEGRMLYILILTGRAEEDRVIEAFEAGADDYITKPFSPKLLKARIRPGIRVITLQEELDQHILEKTQKNAKLEIAKRRLKLAANTDPLTELHNRRAAMKRLEKEWANSDRSGMPLSVVALDIDHFKSVNDSYGHDVGDHVLQATAQSIKTALRKGDTCARMGGEEFLVICPNTDPGGAIQVAERIRVAIEETELDFGGSVRGNVTVSLGVGHRHPGMATVDRLLKAADLALYGAKNGGRNQVVYEPELRRESA